jgi:hypothetical protein
MRPLFLHKINFRTSFKSFVLHLSGPAQPAGNFFSSIKGLFSCKILSNNGSSVLIEEDIFMNKKIPIFLCLILVAGHVMGMEEKNSEKNNKSSIYQSIANIFRWKIFDSKNDSRQVALIEKVPTEVVAIIFEYLPDTYNVFGENNYMHKTNLRLINTDFNNAFISMCNYTLSPQVFFQSSRNYSEKRLESLNESPFNNLKLFGTITNESITKISKFYKKLISITSHNLCLRITDENTKDLVNIVILNVDYCKQFTGKYLNHFPNMKELYAEDSGITDENIEYLIKLVVLHVPHNRQFTGKHLNTCPNIRELYADMSQITDESIEYLIKLVVLHVPHNRQFTGKHLNTCPNVRNLDARDSGITDENLEYLTNIVILNINCCKKFSGTLPKLICNHLIKLEASPSGITDESSKYLINIVILSVDYCKQFTGKYLNHFHNMKELYANSSGITDESVKNLATLVVLHVNGCKQFTGLNLNTCYNLKKVKAKNSGITDKVVKKLRKRDVIVEK